MTKLKILNKPKIIKGDSLKIMKKMNENSVDHIITSPPYNMNLRVSGERYTSRQVVKEFSTKYEGYSDNLPMEEYFEFISKFLDEALRITKGYIFLNVQFLTGNKRALFNIIGEYSNNLKEIIVWDKMSAQPAMAEGVMNSQFETILIFTSDEKDSMQRQFKNTPFKRGTLSNVWEIRRGRTKVKNHGATFSEDLVKEIILNFTKPKEIIMDPFLGTGTAGIVSIENNRNFVGVELVDKYFKHSKKVIMESYGK